MVVTEIVTRHNPKVAQMVRAEGLSDAPIVAVIDSDLRLDDETLPALIAALEADPRAGAASCPTVDVSRETFGDRASAALLSSTPHAFYCLGALAERSGRAHVLCGAFIAIYRPVLQELGGFASLERYIGEDFELARQLHARGYTIATASVPGRITDRGRSLGTVLQRFARWATVTRSQRPHLMLTYPLLLGAGPLLIAAALIVTALGLPYAGALTAIIACALLVRLLLTMTLRRAYGLSISPLRATGAMLLGELTICLGFGGALGRPIVDWRGQRYRVEPRRLDREYLARSRGVRGRALAARLRARYGPLCGCGLAFARVANFAVAADEHDAVLAAGQSPRFVQRARPIDEDVRVLLARALLHVGRVRGSSPATSSTSRDRRPATP